MTTPVEGKTRFGASLQIFAIRTLCATIVWGLVMAFAPSPSTGTAPSPIGWLVAGPVVIGGATLLWGALAWLGSKGVPFTGLFALPLVIAVVVGDPLLFVLHLVTKAKWPEVIPIESLRFVNLAAFVVAIEPPG